MSVTAAPQKRKFAELSEEVRSGITIDASGVIQGIGTSGVEVKNPSDAEILASVNNAGGLSGIAGTTDDLTEGTTKKMVSDAEKTSWNGKAEQSAVDSVAADLTALEGQVTTIEGDLTGVSGSVSTLQTDLTGLEGEVAGIGTTVSGLSDDVTGIQGDIATIEGDLAGVSGSVLTLQTDLTDLEGEVAGIGTTIDGISSQLGDIEAELDNVGAGGSSDTPGDEAISIGFRVRIENAARVDSGKVGISGYAVITWDHDTFPVSQYEVRLIPDGQAIENTPGLTVDKGAAGNVKYGNFSVGEYVYGGGGGGLRVDGLLPGTVYRAAVRAIDRSGAKSNWGLSNALSTGSEKNAIVSLGPISVSFKGITVNWTEDADSDGKKHVDAVKIEIVHDTSNTIVVNSIRGTSFFQDLESGTVVNSITLTPYNVEGTAGAAVSSSTGWTIPTLSESDPTVSDLAADVANLETSVGTLSGSISGIQSDVTDLETSVGTLSGTVSGIESDIATLDTSVGVITGAVSEIEADLASDATTRGPVFFEAFEDRANSIGKWTVHNGSIDLASVETGGETGGKVAHFIRFAHMDYHEPIPFNPNALYRIKCRVRQLTDPLDGQTTSKRYYLGVHGYAADKTTLVNVSGSNTYGAQHYIAASGKTLTASATWTEIVAYFKGHGTYIANAYDPNNPSGLHSNVRYFTPMMAMNYSGGDGTWEIDLFSIEMIQEDVELIPGSNTLIKDDGGELATVSGNPIDAGYIGETTTRKWAAETGADKTQNHTAADTSAVNGVPAGNVIINNGGEVETTGGTTIDAGFIVETTTRKWAAEAGADKTQNHTAADTTAVAGTAAATVRDRAANADADLNAILLSRGSGQKIAGEKIFKTDGLGSPLFNSAGELVTGITNTGSGTTILERSDRSVQISGGAISATTASFENECFADFFGFRTVTVSTSNWENFFFIFQDSSQQNYLVLDLRGIDRRRDGVDPVSGMFVRINYIPPSRNYPIGYIIPPNDATHKNSFVFIECAVSGVLLSGDLHDTLGTLSADGDYNNDEPELSLTTPADIERYKIRRGDNDDFLYYAFNGSLFSLTMNIGQRLFLANSFFDWRVLAASSFGGATVQFPGDIINGRILKLTLSVSTITANKAYEITITVGNMAGQAVTSSHVVPWWVSSTPGGIPASISGGPEIGLTSGVMLSPSSAANGAKNESVSDTAGEIVIEIDNSSQITSLTTFYLNAVIGNKVYTSSGFSIYTAGA